MEYIRNIAFTKLIKSDGRVREFNFRKKHSSGNPLYTIDVADERGNRHYFVAARINDRWMMGELNIPSFIKEVAAQIHDAIEEQESSNGQNRFPHL